jgi:hypothetical protein
LRANELNATETALFGVMQFLFSVGVSWILATIYSEQAYKNSQKKFAIGAFRRIKEIERSVNRAQKILTATKQSGSGAQSNENHPAIVSILCAQDAVNSSIADWADIIGDEIELTREVERLKSQKASTEAMEREAMDNVLRVPRKLMTKTDTALARLESELPLSLRTELDAFDEEFDDEEEAYEELVQEYLKNGHIEFRSFHDKGDTFSPIPAELSVGDNLTIAKGITENRGSCLVVYDNDSNWIAVVINKFADYGMDYDSFAEVIDSFLGMKCLIPPQFGGEGITVEVIEMDDELDESGRIYMTLRLHSESLPKGVDEEIREAYR